MKRKTNLKEKIVESAKVKRVITAEDSSALIAKELAEDRQQTKQLFRAAIEQLQNTEFKNVDEALDQIANLVVEKMKLPEEMITDFKSLLNTAFETDPGLMADLQRSIKIT